MTAGIAFRFISPRAMLHFIHAVMKALALVDACKILKTRV